MSTPAAQAEFLTVDLILDSGAETRAIDAFALSLIKAERQARKLLTYLIFQSVAFSKDDKKDIEAVLVAKRDLYFEGFLNGIDQISPRSVDEIIGAQAAKLRMKLRDATRLRNKTFHGQVSGERFSRKHLLELEMDVREWCDTLATGAEREFGYDGFTRNSFRKATVVDLAVRLRNLPGSVTEFSAFLATYVARKRSVRHACPSP